MTFDPFGAAAPAIFAAFADPERIIYTQAGKVLPAPIAAIRCEDEAPAFHGGGSTLRTISYEIRFADLPGEPTKRDHFVHRGRRWTIEDRTRLDHVKAWRVVVVNAGPAA